MSADEAQENSPPLWQLTALADFALPPAPARETAAKGLAALWRLIRHRNPPQQVPEKTDDQLKAFSDEELARLVPAIDWRPGAVDIDGPLSQWLSQDHHRSPIRIIIGPPYSGHADILLEWSRLRRLPTIAPPTPEQILAQDKEWFSAWPIHDQPWVLPTLERCFLRHAAGLVIVRRFFEQALAGRLGFGLVGCDSWAWSYLQKVWNAPLADVFTLQAFDSERLARYFNALVASTAGGPLCFREARNGRDVLQSKPSDMVDTSSTSAFLKHLAAQSRGNLGVACEYWRASLCSGPGDLPESDPVDGSASDSHPRKTIWLKTGLKEPELPPESTREIAFVLHALLIHKGLPADILAGLLPLPRHTVSATLLRLASERLIEKNDQGWRVTALGDPVTRRFLKNNGYLIDSF